MRYAVTLIQEYGMQDYEFFRGMVIVEQPTPEDAMNKAVELILPERERSEYPTAFQLFPGESAPVGNYALVLRIDKVNQPLK